MSWPPGHYAAPGQNDPNPLHQLQQSLAASMSGMAGPPQLNAATPQATPQQTSGPPAMDNAMQMLLARAMSIPLATVLFQSLMGNQQPPAQPIFQPPPVMPSMPTAQSQLPLMQMMQQALQAASPPPQQIVPPAPATQHLPDPASASTSSAGSPPIQLPPMDPSVARGLLVQLVQQLQQAGQLPYDDVQRLLQPNANNSGQQQADKVEIEVKKEPGLNPICVVSKTESLNEPVVYTDVAGDNSSVASSSLSSRQDLDDSYVEGASGHSLRATRNRQSQPQVKQQDTHQKSSRSSSSSRSNSSTVTTDRKLLANCTVRLERVNTIRTSKPVSPSAAQQSRVDKLKNMKKHYVSTDILQTSSSSSKPEPSTASAANATVTGISKLPADNKSGLLQKTAVKPPLSTSSTRVGAKNIFSIFAQNSIGKGIQPEEPVVEVRPSDPLPPSLGVLLQRSVNAAQNKNISLRSMYLGYASYNMEWLSLVSCTFNTCKKILCQCSFCPKIGEFPRDVAVHISGDHQELLFALNKLKPQLGPLLYIKCSHCNYITVESTLLWIHYDIHHGISDILDCSEHAGEIDLSGPDMPEKFIDIDDIMGSTTAYVCFDCSAVNADPDITASAMLMARHVANHHPNSNNWNGNFVKLMMLTRSEVDPDSIKGSPTYRQAITDDQHMRGRREVYICMFCRYSAFSPYLALSHSITAHQKKTLLYICNCDTCDYQCLPEVDMVQHMKVEHTDCGTLVCSATLVVQKLSNDGYSECPVLVKRTGVLEYVTGSKPTAAKAKRKARPVSSSEDDTDEDEEDEIEDTGSDTDTEDKEEEVSPRRRQLTRNAKTVTATKPQKAVEDDRQTRQHSKAKKLKTPQLKIARIDSDEEVQNMTVTSSNDRPICTSTPAATEMSEQLEESIDDEADNDTEIGMDDTETEEQMTARDDNAESDVTKASTSNSQSEVVGVGEKLSLPADAGDNVPVSSPASQLSRVDRLKNMKKISTDILQSSSSSAKPGSSTTVVATAVQSSKTLADDMSDSLQKSDRSSPVAKSAAAPLPAMADNVISSVEEPATSPQSSAVRQSEVGGVDEMETEVSPATAGADGCRSPLPGMADNVISSVGEPATSLQSSAVRQCEVDGVNEMETEVSPATAGADGCRSPTSPIAEAATSPCSKTVNQSEFGVSEMEADKLPASTDDDNCTSASPSAEPVSSPLPTSADHCTSCVTESAPSPSNTVTQSGDLDDIHTSDPVATGENVSGY